MQDNKYQYKVLFVEDEKRIRDNYVEYLNLYFNDVCTASDGEEAYAIYKEKKPHIMIIDINIPKLNGLALLKKIRETDHTVKAVMLTAHTDTELLLEATSLKLTKYLVKPVNRKDLKEALEQVISELMSYSISSIKYIPLKDNYFWDNDKKELTQNNTVINLTNTEIKLFSFLISTSNKVFTNDEIIYTVWDDTSEYNLETLRTMIKNLRKKLPKDTIQNVFGVGYKIER